MQSATTTTEFSTFAKRLILRTLEQLYSIHALIHRLVLFQNCVESTLWKVTVRKNSALPKRCRLS